MGNPLARFLIAAALAAPFPAALAALKRDQPEPEPPPAAKSNAVMIFSNTTVGPDEVIPGDAVAIAGRLRIEGSIGGNAVAVLGPAVIDGSVGGDAVAVMGSLTLGPNALVEGDAICIGGRIHRAPGAMVRGEIITRPWQLRMRQARPLRWGRIGRGGIPRVWLASLVMLALEIFLALLFPRGIRRCGEALRSLPAESLLAAAAATVAFPVLFVLLLLSLVGIPVAIFVLPAVLFLLWVIGRASFYAWVGRILSGDRFPVWLAVLVGGLICLLVFQVPVAGLFLWLLISWFMTGCVLAALFEAMKRRPSEPPPIPS
jgi:hypothetical protein